jgi:acetyl esterase/lipase
MDVDHRPLAAHPVRRRGATSRRGAVASPVHFDSHRCCPLFIGFGGHETMLGDAEHLARKADEAGVDVTLQVCEGMPHVRTPLPTTIGTQALLDAAQWCRDRLPMGGA